MADFARLQSGDLSPLRDCPFILAAQQESNGILGYDLLRRWVSYRFQKLRYTIQRSGLSWFWPYLEWGLLCAPEYDPSLPYASAGGPAGAHPPGEEARHMIHFGYLKQPHQWSVITDFIHMAQELSGNLRQKNRRPFGRLFLSQDQHQNGDAHKAAQGGQDRSGGSVLVVRPVGPRQHGHLAHPPAGRSPPQRR